MIANPPVTTYFTKFEKKKKPLTVTKPMRAYLPASSFPSTIFSAIWSCNAHACTDLVQTFFPQQKVFQRERERDQTTTNSSRRRRCQASLGILWFHASYNKGTPSLTIVYRLWDNFTYIISNQTTAAASSSSDTYLFFMQITQLLQAAFWWVSTIMLLVII